MALQYSYKESATAAENNPLRVSLLIKNAISLRNKYKELEEGADKTIAKAESLYTKSELKLSSYITPPIDKIDDIELVISIGLAKILKLFFEKSATTSESNYVKTMKEFFNNVFTNPNYRSLLLLKFKDDFKKDLLKDRLLMDVLFCLIFKLKNGATTIDIEENAIALNVITNIDKEGGSLDDRILELITKLPNPLQPDGFSVKHKGINGEYAIIIQKLLR